MANEVGSIYVSIKADMSSLTTSLSGLGGMSANIGRSMGVNIGGGFAAGITAASSAINTFRNNFSNIFEDTRAEIRSAAASFRIFRGSIQDIQPQLRNLANIFRITFTMAATGATNATAALSGFVNGFNQAGGISGLTSNFRTLFSSLSSSLGALRSAFNSMFSGLATGFATVFAVVGVAAITKLISLTKELIVEGIKYNAELEQTKMAFEVMTQSADKANKIIKQLREYADFSTFTTPQVADGAKLLMNYGVAAEDLMHVVRMLGDTSGGNVEKFKSQALAFGQIFSRGRVTGDNLRQLTEAGINPMQELMQITGKTSGQLQDDLEAGLISVDDLVKAFELATSAKGRFYNLQEKQSTTGIGMWSTIIDKFERFRGDATIGLFEGLKPILVSVIGLFEELNNSLGPIQEAFSTYLLPVIKDVLLQVMNLLGLSNGFDNLQEATVGWIQALSGGIKVVMWLANLVIFFFGAFATGVLTIATIIQGAWVLIKNFWSLFVTLGTATILSIVGIIKVLYNNFNDVFKGIYEIGAWAFKGILNKFIEFKNSVADSFLGGKLGIQKEDLLWNPVPKDAIKDVNEIGKQLQDIVAINFDAAIETSSKSFGDSFENLKATMALTKQMALTTNGAMQNLFGDTTQVDQLLEKLSGLKKAYPKDDQKGIKTNNFTKDDDAAKKAADAIKKMGEEIRKAQQEIVKFGDMFEKMTIEKFSPSKILSRTRKFAKALAEFTMNMEILKGAGTGPELLNQIYGMGQKGWGLAKGLVRGKDSGQLGNILGNIASINAMALGQGMQKMVMEHRGTIQLAGTDKNGAYVVGVEIAKDIRNGSGNFVK
jgi:tape measure domain-containing protein